MTMRLRNGTHKLFKGKCIMSLAEKASEFGG